MTKPDEAAIAAAKAAAIAGMQKIANGEKLAAEGRGERDVAILAMFEAGRTDADIARDLDIPKSTVRQARRTGQILRSRRS